MAIPSQVDPGSLTWERRTGKEISVYVVSGEWESNRVIVCHSPSMGLERRALSLLVRPLLRRCARFDR
jgi:hypothetical protein